MKKRVITGLIAGIFGLTAIILNAYFGIFVPISTAFISMMCVYELLKSSGFTLKHPFVIFSEIIDVLFMLSFMNKYELLNTYYLGQLSLLSLFVIISLFFSLVCKKDRVKLLYSSIIIVIIMLGFGCITFWSTGYIINKDTFNMLPLIMMLLCVLGGFISDIAGFFVGCNFGKHKLAPKISPKKSIEGLVGSILAEPIFFVAAGIVLSNFSDIKVNYFYLIPVSLVCALVATFGDLLFSFIKRSVNIKDFGNAMPGHGGFLDRFDSVIFTSLYITAIFSLLPIFTKI